MDELLKIKEEALSKIHDCSSLKELNDLRVFYLGKKGPMQSAMKSMKDMSKEERASFGQVSNKVKQEITQAIEEKKKILEEAEMMAKIQNEKIDISLPGSQLPLGTIHPLTMIREELEDLFIGMGYSIAEGPEVECDHFNFDLMNLPKGSPCKRYAGYFLY